MDELGKLRFENEVLRENLAQEHVKAAEAYRSAVIAACDETLTKYKHKLRWCHELLRRSQEWIPAHSQAERDLRAAIEEVLHEG